MRISKFVIVFIFTYIGLLGCLSTKSVAKNLKGNAKFNIVKATYFDWFGGVERAKGTTIKIIVDNQKIIVDSIYFRNQGLPVELRKLENNNLLIIANHSSMVKSDIVLHKQAQKEYGNKAPVYNKFLFKLSQDEVVLSYFKKEKKEYLKIELIKEESKHYN